MINRAISLLLSIMMITSMSVKFPKTVKVLSIGNSFSQDTLYHLYDIGQSADINFVVGNLNYNGGSLEIHDKNARDNIKAYSYKKRSSSGIVEKTYVTMEEVLRDENWDYITFQQSSEKSGFYDSYQPYLNNLITYVRSTSKNPNIKLALNMTWAYSTNSDNEAFAIYQYDQLHMYNSIVAAYKKALQKTEIDLLIPCATAIQNARTNEYLNTIGDQLTNDGYHLEKGMGRYIAGLTLFESIILDKGDIDIDIFDDVSFVPNGSDTKEEADFLASIGKKSVMEAINSPYKITRIKFDGQS